MPTTSEKISQSTPSMKQKILIRIRKDFIGILLFAIVLFIAAGRLGWLMGWVYFGMNILGMSLNIVVLVSKNPEVLAARAQITQQDTKPWDKAFTAIYGPLLLVIAVVSGLDAGRFGWSAVPAWVQALSAVLFILAWLFTLWAQAANKHFETSVRIQEERGHKTVTGGPYAIVRHPGYAGVILIYAATPPLLGSLWGLIPSAILAFLLILRTVEEDRTLQEELPDYQSYAKKVRFRLLPGIW